MSVVDSILAGRDDAWLFAAVSDTDAPSDGTLFPHLQSKKGAHAEAGDLESSSDSAAGAVGALGIPRGLKERLASREAPPQESGGGRRAQRQASPKTGSNAATGHDRAPGDSSSGDDPFASSDSDGVRLPSRDGVRLPSRFARQPSQLSRGGLPAIQDTPTSPKSPSMGTAGSRGSTKRFSVAEFRRTSGALRRPQRDRSVPKIEQVLKSDSSSTPRNKSIQ